MRAVAAALLLLLLLVSGAAATARACPAIAGADAALEAQDDEARLAWIQSRLARSAHRANVWALGWDIAIVGATAGDLALIPILGDTRDHRIDFGLGAATTIVGIVPMVLWQPRVRRDHRELAALVARGGDRCLLLADAERRLLADAAAERQQRGWYLHAGNLVLNAGITLLFGAFGHWTSGILNGAGGALVGELIIFTEPVDQLADLANYRRGHLDAPSRRAWQLVPTAEPHGVGVVLDLSF